jgi:hypothetical protein
MLLLGLQTSAGHLLLWQPGSVLLLIVLQRVLAVMTRAPAVVMTAMIQRQVCGLAAIFQRRQQQLLLQRKHQRAVQAAAHSRQQAERRGGRLSAATRAQSHLLGRLCLARASLGRLLRTMAAAVLLLLLLPQLPGWLAVQTA